MKAGISTATFYPALTEVALAQIASLQAQCCEIFLNSFCELQPEFLQQLKRIAQAGGVEIVSLHPFTSSMESISFFTAYQRRVQDGLDLYRRYFEAMKVLGARYLILHGDNRYNPYSEEAGFENIARLCEAAKEYSVQVAHENVSRCKGHSLDYLARLSRAVPDLAFTLDIKQAVRSQVSPFQMVEVLGNRIAHIHVSDHNEHRDCLPPGEGSFDFDGLIHLLKQSNFGGSLVIELYRDNYRTLQDLHKSYEFLKAKL